MNGMTFNSSAPWEELAERLKTENVIMAGDLANIDILYLLTLGASLQAGNRGSAAEDNTTAVPESSSSTATTKKTKETYHLIVNERKGHGGFGVVYRVTKTHPVSKASLEICLKQARTQAWDSLVHENEIFNVLHDHPNDYIIRRDFMCKSDSDCFLGLEYFDGRTLSDIITINSYKKWKISHKDLVLILQQQTAAIDHLQKNGIFHCDIKPENIIYHGGRQLSKLIDFGLAVTRTGLGERFKSQGGTTEYMAPETLVDACLERGSDLYGLAATLHHLITLRCPWYSLEGVQAIRDEKIDRKDPNYDVLSRKRRARIRDCIKFDINRYRGEAAEAEAEKQDIPAMAVQQELWGHDGTCEPQVKYIICLMLHHTPTHRPDCTDILSALKSTVNPDIHVHRHISNQSTSSNDDSRGVANGEQSSSTRSSQPSHPHPVVLNYTDLQKSDQSNLAVDVRQPSERSLSALMENTSIQEEPAFSQLLVQSSSQMQQPSERMSRVSAPRFSQLMSTSSVQGPALSQLMGRSSQMQQPSEYMSGHISYPTTDMMSVPESGPQPAEDEYRDEFSDFDHSNSDLVDYVEESSAYYRSNHHYEPDPNQPTADDPTGMTDYYMNQKEASGPPSDASSSYYKVQDVLPDGGLEDEDLLLHSVGSIQAAGIPGQAPAPRSVSSVQPSGVSTFTPVTPEGGSIQPAGIPRHFPVPPTGGSIQPAGIPRHSPVPPTGGSIQPAGIPRHSSVPSTVAGVQPAGVPTCNPVTPEGGSSQPAGIANYSPLSPEGAHANVRSPAEVEDEDDEDL